MLRGWVPISGNYWLVINHLCSIFVPPYPVNRTHFGLKVFGVDCSPNPSTGKWPYQDPYPPLIGVSARVAVDILWPPPIQGLCHILESASPTDKFHSIYPNFPISALPPPNRVLFPFFLPPFFLHTFTSNIHLIFPSVIDPTYIPC